MVPLGTGVVDGSSIPVVSSQSVNPSPSVSVVINPIGSHGSFGSVVPLGTGVVDGSSTPVVSSQSVKPSPSVSVVINPIG